MKLSPRSTGGNFNNRSEMIFAMQYLIGIVSEGNEIFHSIDRDKLKGLEQQTNDPTYRRIQATKFLLMETKFD